MKMVMCLFPADKGKKNRYYVIDRLGNKIYYGTRYQCEKFRHYMKEGLENGTDENLSKDQH